MSVRAVASDCLHQVGPGLDVMIQAVSLQRGS